MTNILSIHYMLPNGTYTSGTIPMIQTLIAGCEAHVHLNASGATVYVWGHDGLPTYRQISKAVKRLRKRG